MPAAASRPGRLTAGRRTARASASGRRADNTRQRHAAVHALHAEGLPIRAIMRRLGMSRGTVRKYARAQTPEQFIGPNPSIGPGKLGPLKPYLQSRQDDGETDSGRPYAEIRERGYRGTPHAATLPSTARRSDPATGTAAGPGRPTHHRILVRRVDVT